MAESPNFFSTMHLMTTCGDGQAPELFTWGFAATGLHIQNSCSERLFFNLQTSATTQDDFIAGCAALALNQMPPFGGLSLRTTSTSTGILDTVRPRVGLSAWASA